MEPNSSGFNLTTFLLNQNRPPDYIDMILDQMSSLGVAGVRSRIGDSGAGLVVRGAPVLDPPARRGGGSVTGRMDNNNNVGKMMMTAGGGGQQQVAPVPRVAVEAPAATATKFIAPEKITFSDAGTSTSTGTGTGGSEETDNVDKRSIYVGNVDYGSTAEELEAFFGQCGAVNRVTIPANFYGAPKGFAYVEFAKEWSVTAALLLDGSAYRGREIKVAQKRTNIYGYNRRQYGGSSSSMGGGGYSGYQGYDCSGETSVPRRRRHTSSFAPY